MQLAAARAARVVLPAEYYGSLSAQKRAQAFTASGLARLDQVQAVADALERAQAEGHSFAQFKKWAKAQDWSLPRHRLELIYRNATQTAYMAGHWRNFDENAKQRPYLMYDAVNDSRTRPHHLALDGVIKPVGDAFWETHACPNGHNCRCAIRSLDRKEAMERGGVTDNVPSDGGADEGWGGDPRDGFKGARHAIAQRLGRCAVNLHATLANQRGARPLWCEAGPFQDHLLMQQAWAQRAGAMPEPQRIAPMQKLHGGEPRAAFERFMAEFDGSEFTTVLGDGYTLQIDEDLFQNLKGKWKIQNEGRQLRLLYNAAAIKRPDEIIFEPGRHGGNDSLWFFARYAIERGLVLSTVATFERAQGGRGLWTGNTAYNSTDPKHILEIRNKEISGGLVKYHRWE